jgi:transcriptional regulator of arginine metabolism
MSTKPERQRAILAAVHAEAVATQAELKALLKARGFDVDQATLSRDIKELGLLKVPVDGGYRYAPLEEANPIVPAKSSALLGRFAKLVEMAGQLVVIRTDPGNASPVAEAIDHLAWSEVVGTLAGDNTVFVACKSGPSARRVAGRLAQLRKGSA